MLSLIPPDAVCQELGSRLRALRLLGNLSQQELAGRAGASLSTIRRLEASGQVSLDVLVRVAQALQVGQDLDGLFLPPMQSIAQAQAATALRQRARKQRHPGGRT